MKKSKKMSLQEFKSNALMTNELEKISGGILGACHVVVELPNGEKVYETTECTD